MVIAATFALRAEFASWQRLRRFDRCADRSVRVYETELANARLRVVLTGIGQRAATAAVATLFHDPPDVYIASGMAGGLNDTLRVGDIVAARTVRDVSGRSIDSDPRLLAGAVRLGAIAATMYSSPTVLVSAEQKRRMSASADAVDMESAGILDESRRLGIPCIAVRAVSDTATTDLPFDLNRMITDDGRLSAMRIVAALARRPRAVPGFVRLSRDASQAAVSLAAFLDRYVEQLAATVSRSSDSRVCNGATGV